MWPALWEFTGSLLSPGRMDNGEACFILSSRNEVDRTAAVSSARGWDGAFFRLLGQG